MSQRESTFVTDFLLRKMPWDLSRPRFMDAQRDQIEDYTEADASFPEQLRQAALDTLTRESSEEVRRALTALTFVGQPTDQPRLEVLTRHDDSDVCRDARTALFEIKLRARAA